MDAKFIAVCLGTISFASAKLSAQTLGGDIKVSYSTSVPAANLPSLYVNGALIGNTNYIIAPRHIVGIDIQNKTEFGEIYITTKKEDKITVLTPLQIKDKYAKSASKYVLYFVDGELVDDLKTMIEEDFIMAINVVASENVSILSGNNKLSLIQISTKSIENTAKAAEIRIKGLAK